MARAIDRGARAQINRHVKTMAATAAGAIVQPPAAYRQNQLIYTTIPRDLHTLAGNHLTNSYGPDPILRCLQFLEWEMRLIRLLVKLKSTHSAHGTALICR